MPQERKMANRPTISFRDWLTFCLEQGWPRSSLFALARLWWKENRDDGGDTGIFVIRYRECTLPYVFRSRSDAVAWGLANYKGQRSGWIVRPDAKSPYPVFTSDAGWLQCGDGPVILCPLCEKTGDSHGLTQAVRRARIRFQEPPRMTKSALKYQ